ncbi:MAG: metallophosphoesterase family protein [Clostridiales bacterium]|nr:metallophosphoesterase family protein [Clostridiales bacterium]MCF8023450.1 metallophosphoesterase family protein [Clostridiales bacterium]
MGKRKSIKAIATVLLGIMGTMLFISLFGKMTFTVEALQFELSSRFNDSGITQLEIPPLGKIKAQTHSTPVKFTVTLKNIDLDSLKRFISGTPNQEEIVNRAREKMRHVIRLYIIKILTLAALGSCFGLILMHYRGIIPLLKGALLGFAFTLILITATYFTYDETKFQNPQYEGVLQAAPQMIDLAEKTFGKIETLSQKMQLIAANLYNFFEHIDNLTPLDQDKKGIRVLHISDLHNNPAGLEFANKIATLFKADMIIDTGDISDFGTPLETMLLERLKSIKKPYLFIPGNHDSQTIKEHMEEIKGVKIVNGLVTAKELYIMGFPDSASYSNSVETSIEPGYIDDIKQKINRAEENIDIAAVHNNHIGEKLQGFAPVILFGHNHKLSVEKKEDSVLINPGTTGASGIRGLQSLKTSYSVVLLHFYKNNKKLKLTAVDSITVDNISHGFTLERKVFNQEKTLPAEEPAGNE